MRLDEVGQSDNVEDRRGGGGGGGGGGFMRGGGLGLGGMVVAGLLAWFLGVDPRIVMGGAELISKGAGSLSQGSSGAKSGPVNDEIGQFASKVFEANERVWKQVIPAQAGQLVRNGQRQVGQGRPAVNSQNKFGFFNFFCRWRIRQRQHGAAKHKAAGKASAGQIKTKRHAVQTFLFLVCSAYQGIKKPASGTSRAGFYSNRSCH